MPKTILSISVIIPVYNRNQLLPRALDSVLAGKRQPQEIIVVDDGSDNSLRPLINQFYPGVVLIEQPHCGVSQARNNGVTHSKGDWIAFLDSDDEWLPDKLIEQVKAIEESGLLISHTNEIWIRNGVRVNPHKKHRKFGGEIFNKCLPLCLISPSSVLINKDLLLSNGGFDETLPVCEDYDLWLKLTSHYAVNYIDKPLIIKHGGHDDQLSRKYWGMDRFRIQAMENLYLKGHLTSLQKYSLL